MVPSGHCSHNPPFRNVPASHTQSEESEEPRSEVAPLGHLVHEVCLPLVALKVFTGQYTHVLLSRYIPGEHDNVQLKNVHRFESQVSLAKHFLQYELIHLTQ